MNTPEIQARIERLNREHPPAKGMEWRAMSVGEGSNGMVVQFDGLGSYFFLQHTADLVVTGQWYGSYFRQVPAEAKEEDLQQIPEELYDGHAVLEALSDRAKPRTSAENVSDVLDAVVRLIKQRIKEQPTPAPAPGLDYERLFGEIQKELCKAVDKFPTWPTDPLHALSVLGEEFGELTKDVLQHVYEPQKTSPERIRKEAIQTAAMAIRFAASLDRYEYKKCDQHSQSLRVREPKPEPDVEPDESTPRLTEVEFQRDGHSHWLIGHLLELSADKPTRFLVLMDDNRQLWVPRCRLRREGK